MPSLYPHEIKKITQGAGAASGFAGFFLPSLRARGLGEEKPVPPYSAIVYKEGDEVRAEDWKGRKIASGEAGVDDASVIQSALDSLTPERVWKERVVIRGDFLLSGAINVPSYTVLDLTGARLKINAIDWIIRCDDATNIEIIGGVLDGNRENQEKADVGGIYGNPCDNVIVEGTHVKNAQSGIRLKNCVEGESINGEGYHIIKNCYAENVGGEVFSIAPAQHGMMVGNTAVNSCRPSYDTANWIDVFHMEGGMYQIMAFNTAIGVQDLEGARIFKIEYWASADLGGEFCLVLGNIAKIGTLSSGNGQAMFIRALQKSVVAYNIIDAGYIEYGIRADTYSGYEPVSTTKCNIIGNVLKGGFGKAIWVYSDVPGSNFYDKIQDNILIGNDSGIGIYIASNKLGEMKIKDNLIMNFTHGIYYKNSNNAIIEGNDIYNVGEYCVFLNGDPESNAVRRVRIINNTFDTYNIGVRLYNYAENIIIKGNEFRTTSGIDDIQIDSTAIGGIVIEENDFKNGLKSLTLHGIERLRRNLGYATENSGTATFSGDGSTTQFSIAHGLVSEPSKVQVTPMTEDAARDFYVTKDDTNIYVNYLSPPPSGSDNVKLSWYAEV